MFESGVLGSDATGSDMAIDLLYSFAARHSPGNIARQLSEPFQEYLIDYTADDRYTLAQLAQGCTSGAAAT